MKKLLLFSALLLSGCQPAPPEPHVNLDYPRVVSYLGGKAIQDESGDVIPVGKVLSISTTAHELREAGYEYFIAVKTGEYHGFWTNGFTGFYVRYNYAEDRDQAYARLMRELK